MSLLIPFWSGKRKPLVDAELLEQKLYEKLELALLEDNTYPFSRAEFRDPVVEPTRLSTNILTHFHPIFRLFQGSMRGKNAYLFGSGPSLQKLTKIHKPANSVFIGTKGIFHHSHIRDQLDVYLFGDSYNRPGDSYSVEQQQYLEDTKDNRSLIKLCSSTRQGQYLIPHGIYDNEVIKLARDYSVIPFDTVNGFEISRDDISESPLPAISIMFPAIVFALYCGAKKIFLVGCDCTDNDYFYSNAQQQVTKNNYFIDQYQRIAQVFDTSFSVINPVGLQMFNSIHTKKI